MHRIVFTAQYLLDLVRDKGIMGLEDHLAAVFAMHHEEHASLLGAAYGGVLGGVVALVIALLVPGVERATQELYWVMMTAIAIAWGVICLAIITILRARLALIRVESTASKDLCTRLRRLYP